MFAGHFSSLLGPQLHFLSSPSSAADNEIIVQHGRATQNPRRRRARDPEPTARPLASRLEALALEGYRSERFSEGQVRRMLGFRTRIQVHAFLKAHNVYLNYSIRELENDLASLTHFEETLKNRARAKLHDRRR